MWPRTTWAISWNVVLSGKLCNRANGYLALMREALHVAVDFIEWRAGDAERLQGGVQVKAGDRLLVRCFSLGLRQNKPIIAEYKPLPHLVLTLFAPFGCFRCCFARHALFVGHGHTQTEALFALADLPFECSQPL